MMDIAEAEREILVAFARERAELCKLLGWTPPPARDHDPFWFRADHGPVDVHDLWPFVLQDVRDLRIALDKLSRSACRPADDGKFDDMFDEARDMARSILKKTKGGDDARTS